MTYNFDPTGFSNYGQFNPGQGFANYGSYPNAGGFSSANLRQPSGFDWQSLVSPISSAGSGLLKGLAAALMSGGNSNRSSAGSHMRIPSRISPVQFAEWLAALSADPGQMRY